MKKAHVQLSEADRAHLEALVAKGTLGVRIYKRALGLLELDRGKSFQTVAQTLGVHHNTVSIWSEHYQRDGLQFLQDKPRSGRPVRIDGEQRAKVTALACSEAPVGHARWSLRLLAEKTVELEYCDAISYTYVGEILKKTN